MIADIGVEAAKKSSGLLNIARCNEKKSERDSHRVLDSFGLGLPIPMTKLEVNTTEIDMQILRLRDWDGLHSGTQLFSHDVWADGS